MNKKLTVIDSRGEVLSCVLSPARSYEEQLDELFKFGKSGGHHVSFDGRSVKAVDCFCQETLSDFPVLSLEDCDEEVRLSWCREEKRRGPIQDLHSHTYYSFCGKDRPEAIVEAAIAGGVELFGICDHNYGVGFGRKDAYKAPVDTVPLTYGKHALRRYFDHIDLIREKYADRIRILRGIEVATDAAIGKVILPEDADISFFDYCLIEHLDHESSNTSGDLFAFAERCGCHRVGVAHTDLFAFIGQKGEDPYRYFKRMAECNIFWEMNVSYDSIHKYREHPYMLRFFEDAEQQAIVRESGVRVSVGFDGHRVEDYRPDRVVAACHRLTAMGIKLAFEE